MQFKTLVVAMAIGLGIPYSASADGDHKGGHAPSANSATMTTGEIRKVDKDANKADRAASALTRRPAKLASLGKNQLFSSAGRTLSLAA